MDLLVVDDDQDVSAILVDILRADGHEVRVAADGQAGLELLSQRRPDLVLLDVEMPVLDGPEMAYRMFLRDCGEEEIPIVLLSGVLGLDRVAATVGTPYYLSKPYLLDSLMAIIARALVERAPPHPQVGAERR